MSKVVFFFYTFVLGVIANAVAQNPYFRHYSTLNGLPTNKIYQIYQDSHKFIWLTSDAGVVKFDGSNFISYRKKDGLSSNDVVRIKEDPMGRIWIFCYNSSINYIYGNKVHNGKNTPFLTLLMGKGFTLDFISTSNKTINFYNWQREVFSLDSNNKVVKDLLFKNNTSVINFLKKYMPILKVSYINQSSSGDWIIWANGGIYRQNMLQKGEITAIDTGFHCMAVFPVRNHAVYVKTYYNELIKVTADFQKEKIPLPCDLLKIKTILEDAEGYLWIAAYDEGVYCLKNNKIVRHFNIPDALGLLQDHEQNIWVSTQSDGVYVLNHDLLKQNHFDRDLFDNQGVDKLCDFPGKGLWCTNTKAAYLLKNNVFYKLSVPKIIQPVNILYLFKNQSLMLGSISNRLCVFENISLKSASKEIVYRKRIIHAIATKKFIDDRLGNSTAMIDQNSIKFTSPVKPSFNSEKNRISERINNAYYNANNELVINSKRNYLYRNNKLEPYTELSWLDGTIISEHLFLGDSAELFNIDGDSLFLLKNHRFYNLTDAFDTPIDIQINKILYEDSTLYLATLQNVFVCHNPIKAMTGIPVHLEPLNISFNNINDILLNKDTLYIASYDGLTVIAEASISKRVACPPYPYLQSITVNDKIYTLPGHEIKLTGKNNIHLSFGCISYSSSSIIYSYKLDGADNKWIIGTGSRIDLVYQNLPKGNYVFKLRVRKANSEWSKPLELAIIIKPTLVELPAFWGGIVFIFSVMVYFIISMIRIQKMKRVEIDHQLVVMEQKALQSMMNPHFIFNSLGSIQNYLLKNNGNEAVIYLSQFARLIRQNLNAINAPMIVLEEEVDRLKNYIDLEKKRLENAFEYSLEIDPILDPSGVFIPTMIIQPIAENSIWHGLATLKEKGFVKISFQLHKSKSMKIIIADNGIGIKRSKEYSTNNSPHQHLGMQIIKKRLALLSKKYNSETSIIYSEPFPDHTNPGTVVEIIMPLVYNDDES